MQRRYQLALGLLLGTALDALIPDPRRAHPVAVFGRGAAALEHRMYADDRARGVAFTAICVGGVVATATLLDRHCRPTRVAAFAAATWTVLGARSLRREGRAVHDHLVRGDLAAARQQVTHLVGRDPAGLGADEIARAALESVAENTCDAIVAPLFWGSIGGLPGLLGYRAANTLDAMVGHRSARYTRFGWAAARLDDVLNVVPARLTAALVAGTAALVGGSGRDALRVARRDGRRHPSPNAGWSEAAFAGALDLRLGGRNVYGERVEVRPTIGDGRPVQLADLRRATRLCATVTAAAAGVAALTAWSRPTGLRGGPASNR